eukprot:106894-Prymnesium_polylepis.1
MHARKPRVIWTHAMWRAGHTLSVITQSTRPVMRPERRGESLRTRVTVGDTDHSPNMGEGREGQSERRESRSVILHALGKVLRVRLWRSLLSAQGVAS